MRKTLVWIAGVVLSVGGLAVMQQATADEKAQGQIGQDVQRQPDQIIFTALAPADKERVPEGFTEKEIDQAAQIRSLLASVTEAAISKGDSSRLLDKFTQQDKQRLGDFAQADRQKLDQCVAHIEQTWVNRYGQNLDIHQQMAQFDQRYTLVEGELTQPALLANWPVKPTGEQQQKRQDQDQPGQQMGRDVKQNRELARDMDTGPKMDQPGIEQKGEVRADHGMRDKNAAVVVLPAEGNLPELYVSLVREGNEWKIDLPDEINSQKLSDNLEKHLSHLNDNKDQWPQNSDEAYRHFTHHVLMALYDVDVSGTEQQRQEGMMEESPD